MYVGGMISINKNEGDFQIGYTCNNQPCNEEWETKDSTIYIKVRNGIHNATINTE